MVQRGLQFWEELPHEHALVGRSLRGAEARLGAGADHLTADRGLVPAAALTGSGRWTFVDGVDEERWLTLTEQTLALTGGEIDMAIEVADRCKVAQPPGRGLRALRLMVGRAELWEQRHIEDVALEVLRDAARVPVDEEFSLLRTRLIERGRHEAAEISGG